MTYYYNPAPGAQNPGRYAPYTVGPNYLKYGEQGGYYYDPTTDTYHKDPNAQKKLLESQGLIEPQPKAPSLTDTLGPIAAVAGTTALTTELGKQTPSFIKGLLTGSGTATRAAGAGGIPVDTLAVENLGSLGGGAGLGAAQGGSAAAEAGLLDSSFLGEAGGADIGSDFLAPSGSGSWFGEQGSFFDTNGMLGAEGSIGAGNVLGAAAGLYGVYNASQSGNKTRGITQGALSGATAGMSVGGPVGAGIGAVIGGLLGATAHESTKDRTNRRYQELATTDNAAFENMKQKGREWSLSGQDTWDLGDDKSAAPIDGMINSYGVLKTFGPEWTQYSPEQQHNIVQGLVNADKINSKQGEYLIDDPEGAKEIAQSIAGAPAGATPTAPTSSGSSSGPSSSGPTVAEQVAKGLLTQNRRLKKQVIDAGDKRIERTAMTPIAKAVGPGGLL